MLATDTVGLLTIAVQAALDRKAFQVAVLDLTELTSFTDGFVICSGAHGRQLGAIAEEVDLRLRAAGRRPLHVEGAGDSEWVLLDYGDFIVHLFTEDKRRYYALDALWGDARRVEASELGPKVDPGELGTRP
jgi:ribosome-associated protein